MANLRNQKNQKPEKEITQSVPDCSQCKADMFFNRSFGKSELRRDFIIGQELSAAHYEYLSPLFRHRRNCLVKYRANFLDIIVGVNLV